MQHQSQPQSNKSVLDRVKTLVITNWQYLPLLLLVVLYIFLVSKYFWTYATPSDPLGYLSPAIWKTTYGRYWPWLDRITLAVYLRMFLAFFSNAYVGGAFYNGFISVLILILSMGWAFRKKGFWAALLVGIFFNTSYLTLGWATYLYTEHTLALNTLIAFILFFSNIKERSFVKPIILAGCFTAAAMLSKGTGVATLAFFLIYIIYHKNWRQLKKFIIGLFIGAGIMCLLFILLYNWQSFIDVFRVFFESKLWYNIRYISQNNDFYGNAADWMHPVLSIKYFPFIALVIALGAYRKVRTNRLFLLGVSFIVTLVLMRQGAPSIVSYIYPAFIFVCLGLAIHLADLINQKNVRQSVSHRMVICFPIIACFLILIGIKLGIKFPPLNSFGYGYSYQAPLDIYNFHPALNLLYPTGIKILYAFGPLALVGLLAMTEVFKSKRSVIIFALVVAFWSAFLHGGLAYKKAEFDKSNSTLYYQTAQTLNDIPAKQFSIYLQNYKHAHAGGWQVQPEKILRIYRTFSDQKYTRTNKYDAQVINQQEIQENIQIVKNKQGLWSYVKGEYILTNVPQDVVDVFPEAQQFKKYDFGATPLYIFKIAPFTEAYFADKQILYETFSKEWIDDDTFGRHFQNLGANAKFNFESVSDEGEDVVRIKPVPLDNVETYQLNLGNQFSEMDLQQELKLGQRVYLFVTARLSNPSRFNNTVFLIKNIQAKNVNNYQTIALDTWKDYVLVYTIQDSAQDLVWQLHIETNSAEDWIDLKSVRLLADPPIES